MYLKKSDTTIITFLSIDVTKLKIAMRIVIIFGLILIENLGICQKSSTLKNQMWRFINSCYTDIKDGDPDGNLKPDVIDDCGSGYLMVTGMWPTCGCGCTSIVGAYRKADSSYVLINTEQRPCTHMYSVTSNVDFYSIMPVGFGLNTFLDTVTIENSNKYSVFYYELDIPRYGTKTKLTLELIPMGMMVECLDNTCLSIEEIWDSKTIYKNINWMFYLQNFVKQISDEKSLLTIMNRNQTKITETEKRIINNCVEGENYDEKLKKVSKDLSYVYFRYKMYERQKYKSLILDWDSKESRFKIMDKVKAPKKESFNKFILECNFWQPTC
jgi:hypothetical protein